MPSPSKSTRLCMFGDSFIGGVAQALDQGLMEVPKGTTLEFWGASGPAFRDLKWVDEAIRPTTDAARAAVSQVNAAGRTQVAPGDFDGYIFFGARLQVGTFIAAYKQWMSDRRSGASQAVLDQAVHDFAISTRAYRTAETLADLGEKVVFVPVPFLSDGVRDLYKPGFLLAQYPKAINTTAEDRDQLWDAFERVAAARNIKMIRQPESTVTSGVLTKFEYSIDRAVETRDIGHKSPEFAALWMQDIWAQVDNHMRAA